MTNEYGVNKPAESLGEIFIATSCSSHLPERSADLQIVWRSFEGTLDVYTTGGIERFVRLDRAEIERLIEWLKQKTGRTT